MPKKTLLAVVQELATDLVSHEVNAINDSPEANQITQTVIDVYEELIQEFDWDFTRDVITLISVGDLAQPTKLKIPDNVSVIDCVKYRSEEFGEADKKHKQLLYLEPCEFINKLQSNNSSEANISTTVTDTGVEFYVRSDKAPTYWTSFDDEFIYFDSYDLNVESTVQGQKATVIANQEPTLTKNGDTIIDLPAKFMTYLKNDAKTRLAYSMKDKADVDARSRTRRARIKHKENNQSTTDRRPSNANLGRPARSRSLSTSRNRHR